MPTPALTAAQNAARKVYDWTGVKLTREQTAQILYQAGFRGEALINMVAIAGRESGYRSGIHGTASPKDRVSGDRGLFGINYSNDKALMQAGIIRSPQDLFDPVVNARAAYYLSNGGSNLFPWGAMKGGWAAGGDPFYGTDRNKARAAVQTAANQGLLGTDYGGTGGLIASPGGTADDPYNWKGIAAGIAAGTINPDGTVNKTTTGKKSNLVSQEERDAFNAYLKTLPQDQQARIINDLKTPRSLAEVAQYMAGAPAEVNRFINYLSTMDNAGQYSEKSLLVAPDPQANKQMTDLLQTFGVSYPNAPNATPALLAFLNGIGLNMATAEDVRRRAIERIGASTSDAMADIDRTAGRNKQNITADLVRRGILSSGESNTRYARQQEDVANQRSDVQRTSTQATEQVQDTYRNAKDLARQQALDRIIGAEQEQATQRAQSAANVDVTRASQQAADDAWARQQSAQEAAIKAQEDAIAKYAAQGVVV